MASKAFEDMHAYGLKYAPAGKLLNVATEDYAAARCLALNHLMHGLVMGAQAAEKYLKAYLLFLDPNYRVRDSNHSLAKLLVDVDAKKPELALIRFQALLERFERHYRMRYPDDPGRSTSMTTADINELDWFVVELNEKLPCPFNYKYRMGLHAAITYSLGYSKTITPKEHWIKLNNQALAPLLPNIAANYETVMRDLHPSE